MDLIFTRPEKFRDKLVGEFTFFCDKFTILNESFFNERRQNNGFCTYVMDSDTFRPNMMAIRFPGATRGHILLDDNNTVKDIVFYKDSGIFAKEPNNVGIYKEEILEETRQFIGRKIIIKNT